MTSSFMFGYSSLSSILQRLKMMNLDVWIRISISLGLGLSYTATQLCPAGLMLKNGSCETCPNGYYGFKCTRKCDGASFGYRCQNRCSCSDNEKCHHEFGCITMQQISTAEEVSESTNIWLALTKSFTFRGKDSTVEISTRRITSTTAKSDVNDLALSQREIIVYSIGAGAFVLIILLCTVCRRRYKHIYARFKRGQTAYNRNRNIPEISLPNIPLAEIEGTYEVIDESIIKDNVRIIIEGNNPVSDTNERNSQTNSNRYLTPCQPSDEELKTVNSIDNTSELFGLSDGFHQTTSDLESTSTTSDVQNNRSSYLNPYQPIVYSADNHEYLSIHDSGSSGSETFFSLR